MRKADQNTAFQPSCRVSRKSSYAPMKNPFATPRRTGFAVEEDAEDDARAEDGAAPQLMPEDDAADGQTQHLVAIMIAEDDRPNFLMV